MPEGFLKGQLHTVATRVYALFLQIFLMSGSEQLQLQDLQQQAHEQAQQLHQQQQQLQGQQRKQQDAPPADAQSTGQGNLLPRFMAAAGDKEVAEICAAAGHNSELGLESLTLASSSKAAAKPPDAESSEGGPAIMEVDSTSSTGQDSSSSTGLGMLKLLLGGNSLVGVNKAKYVVQAAHNSRMMRLLEVEKFYPLGSVKNRSRTAVNVQFAYPDAPQQMQLLGRVVLHVHGVGTLETMPCAVPAQAFKYGPWLVGNVDKDQLGNPGYILGLLQSVVAASTGSTSPIGDVVRKRSINSRLTTITFLNPLTGATAKISDITIDNVLDFVVLFPTMQILSTVQNLRGIRSSTIGFFLADQASFAAVTIASGLKHEDRMRRKLHLAAPAGTPRVSPFQEPKDYFTTYEGKQIPKFSSLPDPACITSAKGSEYFFCPSLSDQESALREAAVAAYAVMHELPLRKALKALKGVLSKLAVQLEEADKTASTSSTASEEGEQKQTLGTALYAAMCQEVAEFENPKKVTPISKATQPGFKFNLIGLDLKAAMSHARPSADAADPAAHRQAELQSMFNMFGGDSDEEDEPETNTNPPPPSNPLPPPPSDSTTDGAAGNHKRKEKANRQQQCMPENRETGGKDKRAKHA